jgi:hypothetical protein
MQPRKVVVNKCYGGFGLSEEAHELAKELSGDEKWRPYKVPRHDDVLVEVVLRLGDKANSSSSRLVVYEVTDKYFIKEYDGIEAIVTPDKIDWQ